MSFQDLSENQKMPGRRKKRDRYKPLKGLTNSLHLTKSRTWKRS